ncbi:hypothetical protein DSO57_1005297 [Entomophthora muscae]|uniref:Uncharacterized protein n=1 Tax=Entomophthora muscae TaxID=34485 RepID=A0ACC2TJ97_9FUNG|nr:hypothetical protein DSO57_1005297 [Entomophthora muscae]
MSAVHDKQVSRRRTNKPALVACDVCQLRKVRCVVFLAGSACLACKKKNKKCTYKNSSRRNIVFGISQTPDQASPPQNSSDLHNIFSLRQDQLLPGELDKLATFRNVQGPQPTRIKQKLEMLVRNTSQVEFRFLVQTILAAIQFHSEMFASPNTFPSHNAIYAYSAAVETIPQLTPTTHLLPIFDLLDLIQVWAKSSFPCNYS